MKMRTDYFNDPAAPQINSVVPSVTAVVVDASQLLLVHRTDNDLWALPGGGHDLGESIENTAVREVKEETGIDVQVTGLVGLYTDPAHVIAYEDGEVRQQFSICFRALPIGGQLQRDAESKEVRWVPFDELDRLNIHPSMRLRIDHGLDPERHEPYLG
jgi:ADP-ribose pyrophosphatase YjhB (NUDIX family)